RPSPRPSPRPRPKPAPAPEPVPEPVVVAPAPAPVPPPAPPPPPAPVVPAQAKALSGAYSVKGGGDPLSISLSFGADGKLVGKVMRAGGSEVPASGTYQIIGDEVSFVLLENAGEQRIAFSGTVDDSGADGRMTLGGQNLGRFSVER
ncbi:MAG: hypothetical protein KC621_31950, partial [Myxococcales bacterium]|nr:hypothetical protein [Myxococcales bacterium]